MQTEAPVRSFFACSDGVLDHMVLRPLRHIAPNWELTWDDEAGRYEAEENSLASLLNGVIADLARTPPPANYHRHEDALVEYLSGSSASPLQKANGRWVVASYDALLEQCGFKDVDQRDLLSSAAGRIRAAVVRGQRHFDDMEKNHRKMLAALMTIILYHRWHEFAEGRATSLL